MPALLLSSRGTLAAPDLPVQSRSVDPAMLAYQPLAAAVLHQAVADAQFARPFFRRIAAVRWLTVPENRDRAFWCHVAGLEDTAVVECARLALNQTGRVSKVTP